MTKRNTLLHGLAHFAEMPDVAGYLRRLSAPLQEKLKVAPYLRKAKKVVSVGCADGTVEIALAEMYPHIEILGIDLDREFIKRARQNACRRGLKNVRFECVRFHKLVERDARYEVVLFCSVLHEFFTYGNGRSSVVKALAHAHELLNEGGMIVIRDMILSDYTKTATWLMPEIRGKMLARIKNHIAADFVTHFHSRNGHHESYDELTSIYALNHLLLKYMYEDNWVRELKEDYVAVTVEDYEKMFSVLDMDVQVVHSYLLPFLAELWKKDFGLTDEELAMLKSTTIIVARKNYHKPRERMPAA